MGREAHGLWVAGSTKEAAQVHLDSTMLVLRGATPKRRIARSALVDVRAVGQVLRFVADGEPVAIELDVGERGSG